MYAAPARDSAWGSELTVHVDRPKEQTFKDAMDRILELEKQGLN